MDVSHSLFEIKIILKKWEENFTSAHGKAPTKTDIDKDDIKKVYLSYNRFEFSFSKFLIYMFKLLLFL